MAKDSLFFFFFFGMKFISDAEQCKAGERVEEEKNSFAGEEKKEYGERDFYWCARRRSLSA